MRRQIHHAAQHPVALDYNQVHAVEARTLLDLRFGAAFTRLQTLRLQGRFPELELKVVSYGMCWCVCIYYYLSSHTGPCQFPTLGFVVSRYEQVKSFRPEQFWYIFLSVARREKGHNTECEFKWRRGHLFEFPISLAIYEMVLENPMARVQEVKRKPSKKWYVLAAYDPTQRLSLHAGNHCLSQPSSYRRRGPACSDSRRRRFLMCALVLRLYCCMLTPI